MAIVCRFFSIFISKAFVKSFFSYNKHTRSEDTNLYRALEKRGVLDDFSSGVAVRGQL